MSGEKFSGTRVTYQSQRAVCKIAGVQLNGSRVAVRLARYLTENPITTTGFGQHNCRAQFGCGQIGKWKVNDDYLAGCKYAHASSSSARACWRRRSVIREPKA